MKPNESPDEIPTAPGLAARMKKLMADRREMAEEILAKIDQNPELGKMPAPTDPLRASSAIITMEQWARDILAGR